MLKYTELKSTGRQNLRDVLPLAKPFTVLVEPSSLCNFRCIQCFQGLPGPSYFTRSRGHMPLARFERALDQLAHWPGERHKVLKLSLYGEPLLTRDFSTMLALAREADVSERIETTTNASLLSAEVAEAMVQHQLDYVRVSIYSADAERHRRITRSPVDIAVIRENLLRLQAVKRAHGSNRPFVSCKTLTGYDGENEAFFAMYREVADEVYLDQPHSWIAVDGADFIGTYYGEGAERARRDLAQKEAERVACPMAFTTMAVRSNGDVSPCCVDFIGGTNLGSMEETDLGDLWRSDTWFAFQKMQLEGRRRQNYSCARCDVVTSSHYTLDDIDGFPVERLR